MKRAVTPAASNNIDDVLTVRPAGLAQEGFYTAVVVVVPVLEMPVDATVGPDESAARIAIYSARSRGPSGEGRAHSLMSCSV